MSNDLFNMCLHASLLPNSLIIVQLVNELSNQLHYALLLTLDKLIPDTSVHEKAAQAPHKCWIFLIWPK